jgi:hypothetical protein
MKITLYTSTDRRLCFATAAGSYRDAFGDTAVEGVLFNLERGTVQTGARCTANIPVPDDTIVAAAFRMAGTELGSIREFVTT